MQRRLALLLIVLLAGLAACTPNKGFKAHDISREDYGDRWPLTVDAAVLACEPGGVPTVTVDGTTYGLDTADEREIRPAFRLVRILADESDGRRKNATVLLQAALALCE
jgi:hypothetical protein